MKIKFWDRLLAALAGLLILLIGVGVFVFGSGLFPFKLDAALLENNMVLWKRAVLIAAAAAMILLGAHGILLLFGKGKDKGFVMKQTDFGEVSISLKALEGMVKKCVEAQDNVTLQRVNIEREKGQDGVRIDLKVLVRAGVEIPRVVGRLQNSVRHYVTSCSGVEVSQVSVMVETDLSKSKIVPALLAPEEETAQTAEPVVTEEVPAEAEEIVPEAEIGDAFAQDTAEEELSAEEPFEEKPEEEEPFEAEPSEEAPAEEQQEGEA